MLSRKSRVESCPVLPIETRPLFKNRGGGGGINRSKQKLSPYLRRNPPEYIYSRFLERTHTKHF